MHILLLEDNASRETSLGASLGSSRAIGSDAGRCSVGRIIEGYEYSESCEGKKDTDQVIGSAFRADGGCLVLALAVESMGQPIFWGREGAK